MNRFIILIEDRSRAKLDDKQATVQLAKSIAEQDVLNSVHCENKVVNVYELVKTIET